MLAAKPAPQFAFAARVIVPIAVAATVLSLSMGLRQSLGLFLRPVNADKLRRSSIAAVTTLVAALAAAAIAAMSVPAVAAPSNGAGYGVPAGFSSRFATANGVRLHYVIGGSGSPILLIHGWPEDWYEWRKAMPLLARDHTVIAVDLRGFGWSEITATGYDRRTLAKDSTS